MFQMPRKRKHAKYSDETIIKAVAEVKNGQSYRKVAKKYGIAVMTLSDKVKGRVALVDSKPGPDPYLSKQQESRLADWFIHTSKIGCGMVQKKSSNSS